MTGLTMLGETPRDVVASSRNPLTLVVLGDSLTEQGGMNNTLPGGYQANGTNPHPMNTGYWAWANVLLGWKFHVLRNGGIYDQTTTQILARLERDVISLRPGWCFLLAGTNDVGHGYLESTTKPNLRRILDRLDAAGIRVAWLTIPPRIGASYSGTQLADTVALNEWIRTEARRRSNVVLCDIWPVLTGNTASTASSQYLSSLYGHNSTSDGIHMSGCGAYAAGAVVAANVGSQITGSDAATDIGIPATGGLNLLADPRFANGGSGSAPTSWTMTNASGVTYAKAARTDAVGGTWQQIIIPGGSGADVTLQGNSTSDGSGRNAAQLVGKQVVATIEFNISNLDQSAADGSQAFYMDLAFYNGTAFTHNYVFQNTSAPNEARAGRFVSAPVTVPAGTITISLFVHMVGGGTYGFDRAGLYCTTESGLLLP